MNASAPRGREKGKAPTRTPSAGLLTAWNRCRFMPDPIGLSAIKGNNRDQLRTLAKLVHCLCDGIPGTQFFLGSVSAGMLLGRPHQTVQNWLRQLEKQGVIEKVWSGKPVRKDYYGKPTPGGALVDRANEYVYLGLLAGC